MKKLAMSTLVATALLLTACGSSDDNKTTKIDEVPPSVFSSYKGIWELKGTGDVWNIDDDALTTYNFNSFGCIKAGEFNLSTIKALLKNLSINADKTQVTLETLASSKEVFVAIEQLPDNCVTDNLLTQTDLATNFDFLWHTMNDYYAFFELRDIDWQEVYNEYRPLITSSTTKLEFFEMIDDIFSAFGDGHLSLSDGEGLDASGTALNGFILEVLRSDIVDAEDDFGEAWQQL